MRGAKAFPALAAGAALLLASCAAEKPALAEQPIERAATCGVVAAAEARASLGEAVPLLPLDAREHMLHYALIAASERGSFSPETAKAVIERMAELENGPVKEEWQELLPLCREAYHDAWTFNVELTKDRFDSKLQCDELGKFITLSLGDQGGRYEQQLGAYRQMAIKLEERLGPGIKVRAGDDPRKQQELRRQALAAASKLGRPAQVMEQCLERYG